MDKEVRDNILRILTEAIDSIKRGDIKHLKELGDQTVHDATVHQDEYSVTIAILMYTLSKIHERETHYAQFKGWKNFCIDCFRSLELARDKLREGDLQKFDSLLKQYIKSMRQLDKKLVGYIQEVLRKARITKASRLHEHGLSLGRTAELLGISKFELMDYIGKTGISDMPMNVTMNASLRLKFTRGLFL